MRIWIQVSMVAALACVCLSVPMGEAAELPQPGSDSGQWGDMLNDFLMVDHNPDGSHKGQVTPQMFGAVADGTNDCTAAINNALATGRRVFFPAGTYAVAASLPVPSGRYLYGEGSASILKATSDGVHLLTVYSSMGAISNIVIRDLSLDGGGQTLGMTAGVKAAYGVYVSDAKNVQLEGLYIRKMGVAHPSIATNDNGYGGYGIVIESRHGVVENVHVERCFISDIAGGGMIAGDGIYIAGFNASTSVVPRGVWVTDCHVENVGRHCFTVAGDPPESPGYNATFRGCTGRNAALCGIDLEEGNNVLFEDIQLSGCGTYTGYYSPATVYGDGYRLRAGIAYGNLSQGNTFRKVDIRDSHFGITLAGGADNLFADIDVAGSVCQDICLGLSSLGCGTSLVDCRFNTPGLSPTNVLYAPSQCNLRVDRTIFASPLQLGGVDIAAFRDCHFKAAVFFSSSGENRRVSFLDCLFTGAIGLQFTNFNTFCEDVLVQGCTFRTSQYGILAVWNSIRRVSVVENTFHSVGMAGIRHDNAAEGVTFSRITGNHFVNCSNGVDIVQATQNLVCKDNAFDGVSGWCLSMASIYSPTVLRNTTIVGNHARTNCVNGLRIATEGGSWNYCVVQDNIFEPCAGIDYSLAAGNANGTTGDNL